MKILLAMAVLAAGAAFAADTPAPAEPPRRMEFAKAMAKAMKEFEDMCLPDIHVNVVEPEPGKPTVEIKGDDEDATSALESTVGLVMANFALKYPGLRFMALPDGTWRVLVPDDIKLPASGDFGLEIP